jgi:hypothetical protein
MKFEEIIREAARWDTAAWMESFGKIAKDGGNIESPICNEFQREVSSIIKWCHEKQRPCRIIILKPRRKGSSTVSVAAGYNRLQATRSTGCIAGGSHYQGGKLFDMLKIYADNDSLRPSTCKVLDMVARFSNGSSMDRLTLANAAAGRSGGYQFLVVTEMALLSAEGVANAPDVVSGLLKTVKYLPDTVVILESTASGASGDYFERYQKAITFEEFKEGKAGYIKVFYPWFSFDDSRIDPSLEGIKSEDDYTPNEADYAKDWGLDMEQVAWMRMTLRDDCNDDFDKFQEDYPSDEVTAFLKSGRGVFDQAGMKHQEKIVKVSPREFGMIQYNERADRMQWVVTDERNARMVRWETPRYGCRYLLAIDPATGEDQTGGDDPDSHSLLVLRDGYMQGGRWIEPAVVMRNMMVPGNKPKSLVCWWAVSEMEEMAWRMARYWKALIVPEMNKDSGLVELLKLRGDVDIYEREMFNKRENARMNAYGWMTDVKTRPMIIEGLERRVREAGKGEVGGGIEVRCPWIVEEMKNFVRKPSGRCEAMAGKHDDGILSLCIGLQTLGMATPWYEEERETGGYLMPSGRGGSVSGGGGSYRA